MKYALLLAALLTTSVFANEVVATSPDGKTKVWVSDQECKNEKILGQMPPMMRLHMYAARNETKGFLVSKKYDACWFILEGRAVLFYEDGDKGAIPLTDFKRE